MASINVRCWAPLRSALVILPLLFLLPALSNLHPSPPAYVWRFKVRETYYQGSTQITRQVGSQDCPLIECQAEILMAVNLWSVSNGGRPYACFAYDQQNPDRCNKDVNTYGGCRWSDCVTHDAYNEVRFGPFFWKDGTFNIRVRDPWDQRWVMGVMGKLYGSGWSSTPSGTVYISREYVLVQEAQVQEAQSRSPTALHQ
ncbi:PREDICTED: ERV-BabFcenv provirus ancestral Env polyprotein-like [Myotis brandtii]|uniref:ERV-BabFcenv provirus ancestral Env polyprotein-like n=1 Tax=Myotis brandtii TaxID=109478 RepID=UPI0007047DB6|nr:PREDICTED: ERV-BabFcenv provirus ancestral Env polyprotein-like [Myotis brandtii]XP_014386482.1 PREDICTED: ERV-BabFcenv provirus ancestral Env polyprotein-like [Myotis brandtii]